MFRRRSHFLINCLFLGSVTYFLALAPLFGAKSKPAQVSFELAPAAAWVKPIAVAPETTPPASEGGVAYLLIERQENLEPAASYYREVRQITSENGVQNGASITASFDPAYQRLVVHTIQLRRGKIVANRLARDQIKLLQRERELENFLYDGAFTAQCELEDVRVGDVIEFAYTIEGQNPVKGGKFSASYATQWSVPVRQVVTRITYPARRKLDFLLSSITEKPAITVSGSTVEWLSDLREVPARLFDKDVPSDHNPRGGIQVSEFHSWQEIVQWALPLFRSNQSSSSELQDLTEKLKLLGTDEERVLAALHFLQNEIRYLGIESGLGSHQPTMPGEVLRRRFGDCKDKTLLLVSLLRGAGLEAAPALVDTSFRGKVGERLPAPDDFDHAIVQVVIDSKAHWLDATRTQQRGPLAQIYPGNFRQALVLRPGTTQLTDYTPPPDSKARKEILESFRVGAPPDGVGELDVTSEYCGLSADRMRASFQEKSAEKLQKDYLHYYERRFPQIETREALWLKEVEGEDKCVVTETYRIPKIWSFDQEKKRYEISFFPGDVDYAIETAEASRRLDPFALTYPEKVSQVTKVEMFDDWTLAPKEEVIENLHFRYQETAAVTGRLVKFTYSFETLSDRVEVAEIESYNKVASKIKNTLGYDLFYTVPAKNAEAAAVVPVRWLAFILWVVLMLFAIAGSLWFLIVSKRSTPLDPFREAPALDGIQGWLLLVAFHQVIRPVIFAAAFFSVSKSFFDTSNWVILTQVGATAYHPLWAPALTFELYYNSFACVASILLLLLFFNKRAVWPWTYAAFLVFTLFGVALDLYFTASIPAASGSLGQQAKTVASTVIAVAVWLPYSLVSKRVRATFRY